MKRQQVLFGLVLATVGLGVGSVGWVFGQPDPPVTVPPPPTPVTPAQLPPAVADAAQPLEPVPPPSVVAPPESTVLPSAPSLPEQSAPPIVDSQVQQTSAKQKVNAPAPTVIESPLPATAEVSTGRQEPGVSIE